MSTKPMSDDDIRRIKERAIASPFGSQAAIDVDELLSLCYEAINRGRDLRTIRDGLVDVQSHLDRVTGRDSKRSST